LSRNPSHQKKSRSHIDDYNSAIRKQRYDPTVDERINFRDSTTPGEDLTEPVRQRRPTNLFAQIGEHVREHWVEGVIGIVVVVFFYFLVDAKVNFTQLFSRVDQQEKYLDRMDSQLRSIENKNTEQELRMRENTFRIEHLERVHDRKENAGNE
jgi:hypothetical protein